MNKSLIITSGLLITLAVILMIFALLGSSRKSMKVQEILEGKINPESDFAGIFEGYYYSTDSKNKNNFFISDKNPRASKSSQTLLVQMSDRTQKPADLYPGARLFVHGIYKPSKKTIIAEKIEASCPSKELDRLEEN